jgi:predicted nucleic acid-binding protein
MAGWRVIFLDTNYLIMGLVEGSREAERLLAWLEAGERLCVSAIVWYEFVCGPVRPEQVAVMRSLVDDVVPFDAVQAEESARLFNAVGRRRALRVDSMIAAVSLARGAALATNNEDDFAPFAELGLRLLG